MGEGFDIITFPTKFPTGAMSCGCSTIGAWVCHADGGSCIYGAAPVEPYQGGQNHFLIGMTRSDNAMVQVAFHWHVTGY